MAAQGVHQHRPLTYQKLPDPVQHQNALLFFALHWNEAHRGSRNGLADRFRICGVILLSFYVWLDVGRRHQPNHMAQPGKNASPVMSCRTGLYPDQARRQSLEEMT